MSSSNAKWGLLKTKLLETPPSTYKGLDQYCSPGTHTAALDMLLRHVKPAGSALDLAAGTGAWLAQLRDVGFTDLNAVELYMAKYFGLDGVTPRQIDLNQNFTDQFDTRYDLVTAIEIMEHLDSPRHFLAQVHRLLQDNGHLLVTMPNIGHWKGRLRFLLQGEHRFFLENDYYHQRHISPVSHMHMKLLLQETGFKLIESTSAGSFIRPLKRFASLPLATSFRLLFGAQTDGDVSIYLASKSQAYVPKTKMEEYGEEVS